MFEGSYEVVVERSASLGTANLPGTRGSVGDTYRMNSSGRHYSFRILSRRYFIQLQARRSALGNVSLGIG